MLPPLACRWSSRRHVQTIHAAVHCSETWICFLFFFGLVFLRIGDGPIVVLSNFRISYYYTDSTIRLVLTNTIMIFTFAV